MNLSKNRQSNLNLNIQNRCMSELILVRHGQSQWNNRNLFTGWVDVNLTQQGVQEALTAAKDLENTQLDIAFTSTLARAHTTLAIILSRQQQSAVYIHNDEYHQKHQMHPKIIEKGEIPVYSDSALNERWYGDLQGKNKEAAREEFGEEQVHLWRRSWDVPPPNGESLKDTTTRTIPYFQKTILPRIQEGKTVIVSAHGNSLRAIIKHLENISDEDIPGLELPTGKPIRYTFDNNTFTRETQLS
jgi:2,3-bisphosphoglycerate-dependent phosphoglycerate mutase